MNLGQILNESLDIVLEDALNKVLEKEFEFGAERVLWKNLDRALKGMFLKGLEGSLEAFEGDLEGALDAASEGSDEVVLGEAASQRLRKCRCSTSRGVE